MNKLKSNKGQALVELAFVLPILLLLIMGIFEFGRIMNAYLILTNASREGARSAAVHYTDAQIQSVIQDLTSTLNQSKLTFAVSPASSGRVSGSTVTLTLDYQINIITPIISNIVPNPYTVTARTVMRVE